MLVGYLVLIQRFFIVIGRGIIMNRKTIIQWLELSVVFMEFLAGVNKFWSLCVLKATERQVGISSVN